MTKWGAEWIDYSPSSENWPTAPEIDGGVEASSLHPDSPIEEETELRIEQGISADCSFVAALAVCLAHNLRFAVGKGGSEKREMVGLDLAKELVVREVGPGKGQEHRRRWYRVKMFVNGDWRSVSHTNDTSQNRKSADTPSFALRNVSTGDHCQPDYHRFYASEINENQSSNACHSFLHQVSQSSMLTSITQIHPASRKSVSISSLSDGIFVLWFHAFF